MTLRNTIGALLLGLTLSVASFAVASEQLVTTITHLEPLQNEQGEVEEALIYADKAHTRLLHIGYRAPYSGEFADSEHNFLENLRELHTASRNGWQVRFTVATIGANDQLEVIAYEIISQENQLTTGLNMPDRDFAPLALHSYAELEELFNSVYPYSSRYYDVSDNCFNRAQFWSRSYQIMLNENGSPLGTDKAFIFFSRAYISEFDHNWWYHVAPIVYLEEESGDREPYVFDLSYLPTPVTLSDWLATFDGYTNGDCVEINSLDDYYQNNHRPVCMVLRASMFNYVPSDLRPGRMLTNWRCGDFKQLTSNIPAPGSLTTNPDASWQQAEYLELIPQMCR